MIDQNKCEEGLNNYPILVNELVTLSNRLCTDFSGPHIYLKLIENDATI